MRPFLVVSLACVLAVVAASTVAVGYPTGRMWTVIGPATTGGPVGSPGSYPLQPFGAIFLTGH